VSWKRWVLIVLVVQLLIFSCLTIAGWGSSRHEHATQPSMDRLGAAPGLEADYAGIAGLTFPVVDARGQSVALAAYAGTLSEWATRPLGHAINIFGQNPIKTFHQLQAASNITYLFVVPSEVLTTDTPSINFKTHSYPLHLIEEDQEARYAVMSASVPNNATSSVEGRFTWLLEPESHNLLIHLMLVRATGQGEGSSTYDLVPGLIRSGTQNGYLTASLPRSALGSPVIANAPRLSMLAGFVSEVHRARSLFVPAARVAILLRSIGTIAGTPKVGTAFIGVSIATAAVARLRGTYKGTGDGALITTVESGSPASAAGLQPGDVILDFDNVQTFASAVLSATVRGQRPGSLHLLTIVEPSGASHVVVVKLGAQQ